MKQTSKRSRHRLTAFHATAKAKTKQISVTVDAAIGSMELAEADPSTYRSVVYYERASGKDKILLDMPGSPELNAFDVNSQLTGQFNQILAVDTNKYEDTGLTFAVACVLVVPEPLIVGATEFHAIFLNAFVIVDPSPAVNAERIGWHIALQQNVMPGRFNPTDRIALVVDSELGDLQRINAKVAPYYGNQMLLANVSLLYASADNPTDTLPSALIRACDKQANAIAAAVRPSDLLVDLQPGQQFPRVVLHRARLVSRPA